MLIVSDPVVAIYNVVRFIVVTVKFCSLRATLAANSIVHQVQGHTADVSGAHESMSGIYQQSRDISQLKPITAPTPFF